MQRRYSIHRVCRANKEKEREAQIQVCTGLWYTANGMKLPFASFTVKSSFFYRKESARDAKENVQFLPVYGIEHTQTFNTVRTHIL